MNYLVLEVGPMYSNNRNGHSQRQNGNGQPAQESDLELKIRPWELSQLPLRGIAVIPRPDPGRSWEHNTRSRDVYTAQTMAEVEEYLLRVRQKWDTVQYGRLKRG